MDVGLIARLLPPGEWSRLAMTHLADVWSLFDPDHVLVFVVEADGRIVATWTAMSLVHLEGLWIHPDHRGRAGTARALVAQMQETLSGRGVSEALTLASDPRVAILIEHYGGTKVEADLYRIPVSLTAPEEL